MPAARPSRPSVRLTAFAAPATTRKTITKNATDADLEATRSRTGMWRVVGEPDDPHRDDHEHQRDDGQQAASASARTARSERFLHDLHEVVERSRSAPHASVVEQHEHRLGAAARQDHERQGGRDAGSGGRPSWGCPASRRGRRGSGPAARTNWPTSLAPQPGDELGAQEHQQRRRADGGDQDAGHAAALRGRDDGARRAPGRIDRDPFSSTTSPGAEQRRDRVHGLVDGRRVDRLDAGRALHVRRRRARPTPIEQVDAGRARRLADLAVVGAPRRGRAPSCPRARPPAGPSRPARSASAARIAMRVGVVAVLDQGAAHRERALLPAHRRERDLDAGPFGRHAAERPAAGERGGRVAAAPRPCSGSGRGRGRGRRRTRTTLTRGSRVARCRLAAAARPAGTTATPPGRSAARISALAAATASTVPSSSRCTGPMEVMQADVRRREGRELGDLTEAAHAHLHHRDLGALGERHERHRARRSRCCGCRAFPRPRTPAARSIATRMSLVVVLPVAPVMPTTRAPLRSRARRPAACSTASGTSRRSPAGASPAQVALDPAPCRLAHHGGRGAVAQGVGGVLAAVGDLAPQPHEEGSRHDLARVDAGAVDLVGGEPTGMYAPPVAAFRSSLTVSLTRLAPSTSRATSRSSKGVTTPLRSWPCSCPLPAITTTSPAEARSAAQRDRARAGRPRQRARAGPSAAPTRISAMIASGSSVRGLSEVTTATSARPRATSAHLRALAAVAVAAAAEHHDETPTLGHELAGRAQHVVERVGRVRVVDDHLERLAPRRPASKRPGTPGHRGDAAGHGVVGEAEQLADGDDAGEVGEVEAPPQADSRSRTGPRGVCDARRDTRASTAGRPPGARRRHARRRSPGRPTRRPGGARTRRRGSRRRAGRPPRPAGRMNRARLAR